MKDRGTKMDSDKRDFLSAIIRFLGIILGVFFLYKYLIPTKNHSKNFLFVKYEDIPGEGALVIPEKKLAVLRIKGKIEVYSTVCTHLGCNVSFSKEGFSCPCHGSKFDVLGNVVKGPATKPLRKIKFKIKSDGVELLV